MIARGAEVPCSTMGLLRAPDVNCNASGHDEEGGHLSARVCGRDRVTEATHREKLDSIQSRRSRIEPVNVIAATTYPRHIRLRGWFVGLSRVVKFPIKMLVVLGNFNLLEA